MPIWIEETPSASCPTCGVDTALWRPSVVNLTWCDDAEREAGYLAVALMAHRYAAHRVDAQVGDLVRYWSAWRGLILGSEVYEVVDIREHDAHDFARRMGYADLAPMLGLTYSLRDPARPNDDSRRCWPFVGDPDRPIVFEVVHEAPPAELDLLDLLEWVDA